MSLPSYPLTAITGTSSSPHGSAATTTMQAGLSVDYQTVRTAGLPFPTTVVGKLDLLSEIGSLAELSSQKTDTPSTDGSAQSLDYCGMYTYLRASDVMALLKRLLEQQQEILTELRNLSRTNSRATPYPTIHGGYLLGDKHEYEVTCGAV